MGYQVMQSKFLSRWVGAGVLALSLAVLPSGLPASGQTTTGDPTVPGDATTVPGDTVSESEAYTADDSDGFDWGWLGLLGLIGLAGLRRRQDDDTVRYRSPDDATTTSSGPRY